MPFLLDSNPEPSEISDAINYLLANFGPNLSADPVTGQISGPQGIVVGYLYRYMAIKYADSPDGSLNFSDVPTNRQYYGLCNSDSPVESTNPADYIWYKAAGGFSTYKFLFYQTNGGRAIQFSVAFVLPNNGWKQDNGTAIDLDIVTALTITKNAYPTIYQWTTTSTAPTRPTSTTEYTWSSDSYSAPSSWSVVAPVDTTFGHYLWALTVPVVQISGAAKSIIEWTNTGFEIRCVAYNTNGIPAGLTQLTAYKLLNKNDPMPTGFPQTTSGNTAPTGWSLTAPSASYGQVIWYSKGLYNSTGATISGVPPTSTTWSIPFVSSVFQDIQSDNWNGSIPPTYGNTSTYGTQGYYISRSTGDAYFNDGAFRGDLTTDGDAYFAGKTPAGVLIPAFNQYADYSSYSYAFTSTTGTTIRVGTLGRAGATTAYANIGVLGEGTTFGNSWGVVGVGSWVGGGFFGNSASSTALQAQAYSSTAPALDIALGRMTTSNNTMVANLNSEYSNKLVGSIGNILRFDRGTLVGSSTATFAGTNKPGSNSTNVWIQVTIDSTTLYIPAWT